MKPNNFIKSRHSDIEDIEYYNSVTVYDVYSRNFDDYKSVIECLHEVEEIYKTEIFSLENNDALKNYCFSLFIYNKWKSSLRICMHLNKWRLGGVSLLTNEWKENLQKLDDFPNYVWVRTPENDDIDFDECEFISKEKACLLLYEWLETNEYSKDLTYEEYSSYRNEFYNLLTNKYSSS
ncbi:hypothetical protein [Chamaesiphon polymorphus]|nr:hypothetical protein [Chamaesiphon polymorphus]